jgi:hypothetical protein
MDKIWVRHSDSQVHLHEFQLTHFYDRDIIDNLRYNSQQCWASLAEVYLNEAELPPLAEQNALARYLEARYGIG